MKINKLVITIFFSAVGLFVSTALQAQEAKTLFVNMPDSLSPLLTKVNREAVSYTHLTLPTNSRV